MFEYNWEIEYGGVKAIAYPPTYNPNNIRYPTDPQYAPNNTSAYEPGQERPFVMPHNATLNLSAGQKPCVYGYVRYRDRRGIERRTGFMREYDSGTSRFSPVQDPDYEYED